MVDNNKGAAAFADSEGLLTELSTTDEAALTGGWCYGFRRRGFFGRRRRFFGGFGRFNRFDGFDGGDDVVIINV